MFSDLIVILSEVEPSLAPQIEASVKTLDLKGLSVNFHTGTYIPFITGEKGIFPAGENINESFIMEVITTKNNLDTLLFVLTDVFEEAGASGKCLLICTLEELQKYKPLQFELTNF